MTINAAPTAIGTSGRRPRRNSAPPNARAASALTTRSPANRASVQTTSCSTTVMAGANTMSPWRRRRCQTFTPRRYTRLVACGHTPSERHCTPTVTPAVVRPKFARCGDADYAHAGEHPPYPRRPARRSCTLAPPSGPNVHRRPQPRARSSLWMPPRQRPPPCSSPRSRGSEITGDLPVATLDLLHPPRRRGLDPEPADRGRHLRAVLVHRRLGPARCRHSQSPGKSRIGLRHRRPCRHHRLLAQRANRPRWTRHRTRPASPTKPAREGRQGEAIAAIVIGTTAVTVGAVMWSLIT